MPRGRRATALVASIGAGPCRRMCRISRPTTSCWKTSWAGDTLIFNGALFRENWKDFQFSYLGQKRVDRNPHANQAKIDGLELDLTWAATYNLQISGGFAWYDAKLTANFCGWLKPDGKPETVCPAGSGIPMAM